MLYRLGAPFAAVLVAAVLLMPSVAHAEKVVTEDPAGDVQQADLAIEGPLEFVPAPDDASTDIVRTVAAYGATRLSVTVHFRDLLNTSFHQTHVKVVTPRGSYLLGAGRRPGSRVEAALMRGGYREVECRGLRAKFDGGTDTMSFSVPASCLDDARWVRLGVGAIGVVEPEEGVEPETFPVFADDGHRDGAIRDNLAQGPRIHRG
ncbi:hypothetical protein [Nocardioides astragali]|uniref:Uncharacterized protein n=1 Tax=Nocardioides astragali TaxID=1776736 RepID=A0ABW2N227_9ACTN|nr:hypothetical protein [Nocardioides astragali]